MQMYASHQLNIRLESIGKKFGTEWIFKNINLDIKPGDKMVILGGNGSGKSTLLQVISGYVLPNQGNIRYEINNVPLDSNRYKDQVSLASPYLELVDEFSLPELARHCEGYKPYLQGVSAKDIPDISELTHAKDKAIKLYSSGMRQRVKLALAILADAPLLLLDEPASNLDKNAISWYQIMIDKYASHKTVIVCSNSVKEEFAFCSREINVGDFKQNPAA